MLGIYQLVTSSWVVSVAMALTPQYFTSLCAWAEPAPTQSAQAVRTKRVVGILRQSEHHGDMVGGCSIRYNILSVAFGSSLPYITHPTCGFLEDLRFAASLNKTHVFLTSTSLLTLCIFLGISSVPQGPPSCPDELLTLLSNLSSVATSSWMHS